MDDVKTSLKGVLDVEMVSEHVQRSHFTSTSRQQNHSGHLCYKQMDGSPIKTTAAFIYSLQFKPFQERLFQIAKKHTSKLAPSISQVCWGATASLWWVHYKQSLPKWESFFQEKTGESRTVWGYKECACSALLLHLLNSGG